MQSNQPITTCDFFPWNHLTKQEIRLIIIKDIYIILPHARALQPTLLSAVWNKTYSYFMFDTAEAWREWLVIEDGEYC